MSRSCQRQYPGRGSRPAWEAPAVRVLPIRATTASPSWHMDGWKDGAMIAVTAPLEPPTTPRPRQVRPVPGRHQTLAPWEAPAVTAFAIDGR